jgi:hypothetical protein
MDLQQSATKVEAKKLDLGKEKEAAGVPSRMGSSSQTMSVSGSRKRHVEVSRWVEHTHVPRMLVQ